MLVSALSLEKQLSKPNLSLKLGHTCLRSYLEIQRAIKGHYVV